MRHHKKLGQGKIMFKGYTFHKFPIQLDKKDYDEVISLIAAKLRPFPNTSLYLLKNENSQFSPGFSDLDFLVVNDNPDEKIRKVLELSNYDGKIMFNLGDSAKFVCGEQIAMSKPTRLSVEFRHWDDIGIHTVRQLYKIVLTKNIDVRYVVHKLNGLKHGYPKHMLKMIGLETRNKIIDFINHLNNLRKNWFNQRLKENLNEIIFLLNRAIELQEFSIKFLNEYYLRNYLNSRIEGKYCLIDKNFPIIFKKAENYFAESERLYKKYNRIICIFPPEFLSLLSEYSFYNGKISNYLAKNLDIKLHNINKKYVYHSRERIEFYNHHSEYCFKYNLGYGPLINFDLHSRKFGLRKVHKALFSDILERAKIRRIILNSI